MEQAKQVFLFNIRQKAVQHHITLKQGDTAFTLYAAFSDGDRAVYPIEEHCTVCLRGVTPAGNQFFNECEKLENNMICYTFSPNFTAVAGEMECEFVIYGAENRQITAQKFILQVEETAGDENEITQTAEYSALNNTLSDAMEAEQTAKELEQEYRALLAIPPAQGEKGEKGDQGEQGPVGPQGPQGEIGPRGPVGPQGEKGEKGEKGDQGEQGEKGEKGDPGQNGVSAYHSWNGTVLTVSSASGGSSVDLKGEKGEQGDVGPRGPQGPQGIQGEQGPQGEKGEQGPQGLLGPQGVAGYTPKKGVDYFTQAEQDQMVADVTALLDGIPEYWKPSLEEGAQAINTALCNAGANKSAFLFYSDAHWGYGSQISPKLLKYLYRHTGMTKTLFGGDIVNDEANDYGTMAYLWQWREMLKDLPNHHSVVGNHDDGNATNNLFSEQYVYGYLLAPEETETTVRGDSGLYYYIDNGAEKTRYLFLDTAYQGMSTNQQDFIKQALLSTPEGWHIVVVAHIWYYPDYDQYDVRPIPIAGLDPNASKVITMLDAYNSRTGDYADCGGWVEFCIGGHVHIDYDGATSTGIPIILVETDSEHTRSGLTYTAGTATEASVNGIIADYDNHKIHIIRIGRGESREIAVTNYQVSYTNVLPTALAADGVSVYNGKGYKENTRWSSSGNSEGTASGIYLTGFIPISAGDVIRLKNIIMPNENSNKCMLHWFADNFNTASANANNTLMSDYCVWDESGNLCQINIPSNVDYTHLRIQCGGIDASSIITVNEPIE